ncbi:MAG: iron ABC transporter permease [Acidobacteriota bacterium]|nr:iron ABC transporter permease [Acidobacteriota bacterium]
MSYGFWRFARRLGGGRSPQGLREAPPPEVRRPRSRSMSALPRALSWAGGAALLGVVALVSMCLGKYPVSPKDILAFLAQSWFGASYFSNEQMSVLENVLWNIRLPRVLAAALIGSALSVSGAAYQAMFVNPLVSPSLLGVLGGASLGAAAGIVFLKSWYAVQLTTFAGGILAVGVAVGIARVYRVNSTIMLVLGGIISGALFTSMLELVKYVADPYNELPAITYWLMGNLSQPDRETTLRAAVPICLGIGALVFLGRHLNVLSMGDEEARALGVNAPRIRLAVIVCATVVSATTVVIAGSIGWIGLIIPHFTRMVAGPDNDRLLPAAAVIGAAYLIVVDDVCRLAFSFELPIGIVTSLVGIPCFAFVLRNARKGWS